MAKKYGLMGEVNLLGLNAFGGDVAPLWGTIIGGSVAGVTSMTLGHIKNGTMAKNRELYGFLAGAASSGLMLTMQSTRKAAFGALVGAFFGSGLAWLEKTLLDTVQLPKVVADTATAVAAAAADGKPIAGLGIANIKYLNGLGLRRQANGTYLNGLGIPKVNYLNGLGIPSIAAQPQSVGTIPGVAGVAGPSFAGTQIGGQSPVSLLGQPGTRSNQISMMGGPQVHGLSAAYGATLLGGR